MNSPASLVINTPLQWRRLYRRRLIFVSSSASGRTNNIIKLVRIVHDVRVCGQSGYAYNSPFLLGESIHIGAILVCRTRRPGKFSNVRTGEIKGDIGLSWADICLPVRANVAYVIRIHNKN